MGGRVTGILAGALVLGAGDAAALGCEAQAGYVGLTRGDAAGVHAILDPAAAVQACALELAADPGNGWLAVLLARARLAADPEDPGLVTLVSQPRDTPLLAAWMLGRLYEFGFAGVPANEAQARAQHEAACAGWPSPDAAPGCTALAVMRIEGRGGPADETGGFNLLRNLCQSGWGPACTEAAFHGELRGDDDPARLADLFRQGCEAGDLMGCSQYGFRLELGEGVARDIATARALYELACDGGEGQGCSNLGEVYRSGLGVAPDIARAVALFERGCAGADSYACVTLGDIHANARGVPADPDRALALFQAACDLGDPEGCDLADRLRASVGP